MGFPGGSVVKNLPANAGDTRDESSIPGLGRSLRVGNGSPLQYSCLENSMDRGAWWAIVHEVAKVRHELATEHTCSKIGTKLKKIQPCFVGSHSLAG